MKKSKIHVCVLCRSEVKRLQPARYCREWGRPLADKAHTRPLNI
ncbi:hypothetical protein PITC_065570 [Penicillium italicum]|uniref:Uncharacterized protein n=1 Tax=Penicillium italicum TaxID=40296 RepID=A0A0A2KVN8_PENIT|nr:hypothetical protein PITC_065570 [Penicillium italicum]